MSVPLAGRRASGHRISADIGGTFTDFILENGKTRTVSSAKVPTNPENPALSVLDGLRHRLPDLSRTDYLVHGTTVGLNAFLERKGSRLLLIMSEGVGDSYSIARGDRRELYALHYRKPEMLVAKSDVMEVRERLKWNGEVLVPLRSEDFEPIIDRLKTEEIESVAVCFLHSYAYPQHELQAGQILKKALPDLSITLSHQISREWREYERASTAVMNAYIAPIAERYLHQLGLGLNDLGKQVPLHIMQSNGGVMTADMACLRPVQTLLSGPVGGTIGGLALARRIDQPNLLCVDMGGTSFDISLIVDGLPRVASETEFEGLPLLTSTVEIKTIGAGGGSLAWLELGNLRVGPRSAGSMPGPACYQRGGNEPTVTDANLILGRLACGSILGGDIELDVGEADRALNRLARSLGLNQIDLAEGILTIVNAKMADAIRTITIRQGIDPRDFSLVAYGGAGPMHAVWLARELGISEVIIPWTPGTFSAWGMLQTDMRHDLTRNFYRPLDSTSETELEELYKELEEEGRNLLETEHISAQDTYFEHSADMRYRGQEYSITVPVQRGMRLRSLLRRFHETHEVRYGHATPEAPAEFVHLRTAAFGRLTEFDSLGNRFEEEEGEYGSGDGASTRSVIFEGRSHETPIVRRSRMNSGGSWKTPLIVEETSATTVIPPGCSLRVDRWGLLIITVDS